MQTLQTGTRGLGLLVELNWDRALFAGSLALGLVAGVWMSGL